MMTTWIKYNGMYYNLDVLLRIEPMPDGGYSLQHQNQTVVIAKSSANSAVITKITHYLTTRLL
jgi:hypothetical protein